MAQKPTPKKKTKSDETDDTEDKTSEDQTDDTEDDEDTAEAENRRLNAIVTSRVKREMKSVNATLLQLQETLNKLAAPKAQDPDEDDDEETTGDKKEAQVDLKTSRKLSKLEKELAEEKQARKQAEVEKAQEQEKAKRTEMRTIYSAALQEHGVTDPKLLRAALNVLEEDGVMMRDEDGKVKFKGQDKYGIETNFDPKVGLKAWVATEGKSFVPAIEAGGSGTGGARNTSTVGKKEFDKMDPKQRAAINLERACGGLPPLGEE